jgi:hypothetical protein
VQVTLVALDWLKCHEEVLWKKVDVLHRVTLQWGCYTRPLLVDSVTGTILDGHHRYHVGCRLGLKRLPAVLVDYLVDESVTCHVWASSGLDSLSKQDVIAMAESDTLYPPKTSRHVTEEAPPPIHVDLKILMQESD